MPATPFDPSKSVIAYSTVPLDTDTLEALQPEDYLLVHSAPCSTTNEVLQETNSDGDLVLYVAYNFQLVWKVDADVLAFAGLANYHPGTALSTHALAFANGQTKPFQYPASAGTGDIGRMIYENPVRSPIAGDMTTIQFDIRQIFNDNGTTYDPGDPDPGDSTPPDYSTGGVGLVWMRMVTIKSADGTIRYFGPYFQTRPVGSGVPSTLDDFWATVDPYENVPGENEVVEVMRTNLPGGQYLLSPGAGPGEILGLLQGGASTAGDFASQNPLWNFSVELVNDETDATTFAQYPQTDPASTTWEQVADAYPPEPGWRITGIYSLSAAGWLAEPEV